MRTNFAGLRFNTGLIKLRIQTVSIQDIPALIDMLRDNTTLEIVSGTFNPNNFDQVPHETKTQLVEALKNSSLLELTLSGDRSKVTIAAVKVIKRRVCRYSISSCKF